MLELLSKLIRQSGRLLGDVPSGSLSIESTFATVRLGASESKKFTMKFSIVKCIA